MSSPSLQEKYESLKHTLRDLGSVAVAFSAGVDSTLLLKVASDTLGPGNVLAVTADSASLARDELEHSKQFADSLHVEHLVVATDEFTNESYTSNPTDRCYHCKSSLFSHMGRIVAERGLGATISGTNADDYGDFRPGLQAGKDHGVRAPLAEAGMTKQDLRVLSRRLGLETYDKPAAPCLSSRVPYGERITPKKLAMIEAGEKYLHQLGIRECRVRHHNNLARIEVPPDAITMLAEPRIAGPLHEFFKSLGYAYVTLDLKGFRSGSLNEVIALGRRQSET